LVAIYIVAMAWILWLLGPVCTTVVGALLIWWRGRREHGAAERRSWSSMAEHRALLEALRQGRPDDPMPVNIVVLTATSDPVGRRGG
jgi:hypothetical protein